MGYDEVIHYILFLFYKSTYLWSHKKYRKFFGKWFVLLMRSALYISLFCFDFWQEILQSGKINYILKLVYSILSYSCDSNIERPHGKSLDPTCCAQSASQNSSCRGCNITMFRCLSLSSLHEGKDSIFIACLYYMKEKTQSSN